LAAAGTDIADREGKSTEQAAAEFINGTVAGALTILADRAETAEELGHWTAARLARD